MSGFARTMKAAVPDLGAVPRLGWGPVTRIVDQGSGLPVLVTIGAGPVARTMAANEALSSVAAGDYVAYLDDGRNPIALCRIWIGA